VSLSDLAAAADETVGANREETGPDGAPPSDPDRRWQSQILGFAYPVLFVFMWILNGELTRDISPYAITRTMALGLAFIVLVVLMAWFFLRDMHRAGVAATLVLMATVSRSGGLPALALIAMGAVAAILLDRMPARRIAWSRFSVALSTFSIVLIVLIAFQAVQNGYLADEVSDLSQGGPLVADDSPLVSPDLPDIYVVVLDGHPRADTARSQFGLDETAFLSGLEQRGFEVPTDSHSNYFETPLTFASMLNMAYVDQIPSLARIQTGDPVTVGLFREAISRNAVFDVAREHGYQTVATGSGWETVAVRSADVYLDGGQLNYFEATMLRPTYFGSLIDTFAPSFFGDQMRARVDGELNSIEAIATTPSPKPRLVFVHVTAPHPPLVFGAEGRALPLPLDSTYWFDFPGSGDDPALVAAFRDQTAYIDMRVTRSVDAILSAARRPTVVVLMSDHGARMDPAGTKIHLPEALDNFLAVRTPGHARLFGDSPTPVNLFPYLFNAYMGSNLPIQPNRYFTAPWDAPLQLTEIQPQ
jgi:hypothetical protein